MRVEGDSVRCGSRSRQPAAGAAVSASPFPDQVFGRSDVLRGQVVYRSALGSFMRSSTRMRWRRASACASTACRCEAAARALTARLSPATAHAISIASDVRLHAPTRAAAQLQELAARATPAHGARLAVPRLRGVASRPDFSSSRRGGTQVP